MKIFISGGSSGIGRAIAYVLAKNNEEVFISYYKDEKSAREIAKEIGVKYVHLDVKDNESIDNLKRELSEWRVDVIVNNAGVAVWKSFKEHSFEDIESLVRTNIEGAFKVAKIGVDLGVGMIVNIGSGASKHPYSNLPVYCSTKAALRMLTFATGRPMILVNPGMTKTKMTGYSGVEPERVAKVVVDVVYGRKGRFGEEVDV